MSSTFDTTDMAAAIDNVDNVDNVSDTPAAETQAEEAPLNVLSIQELRDRGFVPRHEYNYAEYNATTREAREGLTAEGIEEPAWLSSAARYEWCGDFGDVGPANEELEKQLFRSENAMEKGEDWNGFTQFEVAVEGGEELPPATSFENAGLHPVMLDNVIRLCKYEKTTPIQAYCMPAILNARDVVAIAQTGSGKTAAYLIPIISRLMGQARKFAAPRPDPSNYNPATDRVRAEPLVIIIVPARELAAQIFDEARRLCYRSMLRPCVIYGGGPPRDQIAELQKGCDILIATPGRMADFMDRTDVLSLNRVKFTVIDEADELMDGDWEEDIQKILSGGDTNDDADHLYFMFSATFPKEARRLAKEYMSEDYVRIRVGRAGSTHSNITQRVLMVEDYRKDNCLYDLITSLPPSRTIIFVNSKRKAEMVDDFLYNKDLPVTSIHADRTQREREDALRAFRNGTTPLLVATGVMARGLDVGSVGHVINYDLPSATHGGIQEYVHRIGRTARIGNRGLATSFYNDRNEDLAEDLAKILVEHNQEFPDFLEPFKPAEDEPIEWDDKTDDEEEANDDAGYDANGSTPVGGDEAEESAGWQATTTEDDGNANW
ncbi:putative DEAD/DEAH box RNA helicase [Phyllosticta citribraziliensis]|uniref:RNA helicase n=1 Tax=Phyllosticta citribraziliensis TaxID=989973 RepID=A0ABR1LPN2_9PEZI